ncbi:hypothetical protein GGS23DRAFT_370643 [Durotheca rogersii]|uniref:uncharacterized protein n=1 Tax=Durotheca rogersii TaxID=419775 RepID=UPI00221F3D06|nr:uncharacterized protein GGS23DRAFT_370643 [Durotheca rogersii]KAI5866124.1 hypothetical protein GGS23DRAFT_370643 [Durotheca rogersii]
MMQLSIPKKNVLRGIVRPPRSSRPGRPANQPTRSPPFSLIRKLSATGPRETGGPMLCAAVLGDGAISDKALSIVTVNLALYNPLQPPVRSRPPSTHTACQSSYGLRNSTCGLPAHSRSRPSRPVGDSAATAHFRYVTTRGQSAHALHRVLRQYVRRCDISIRDAQVQAPDLSSTRPWDSVDPQIRCSRIARRPLDNLRSKSTDILLEIKKLLSLPAVVLYAICRDAEGANL